MDKEKLANTLKLHAQWLDDRSRGHRAILNCADLSGADLSGADLKYADLKYADLKYADLQGADLSGADLWFSNLHGTDLRKAILQGADLKYADLRKAILQGADLLGADLDYSCIPLWCGSLDAHFDDRQLRQIAYHLVRAGLYSKNASKDTKAELSKLIDFANGFHRVRECGKIKGDDNHENS